MKPALRAEDWKRQATDVGMRSTIGFSSVALHIDLQAPTGDQRMTEALDSPERHAVAAFALHQQPFGFSRHDVAELRNIGDALLPHEGTREAKMILHDVADRIEALLPPE